MIQNIDRFTQNAITPDKKTAPWKKTTIITVHIQSEQILRKYNSTYLKLTGAQKILQYILKVNRHSNRQKL